MYSAVIYRLGIVAEFHPILTFVIGSGYVKADNPVDKVSKVNMTSLKVIISNE